MALPVPMPMRNERTAPTFDTARPRELPRFFEDLEYLMERATIVTHADKKKQVVRYTDFDTEQIWKSLPEFKNAASSYDDFKKAIMVHYPEASGDFMYSLRDMDLLIGERQRIGMTTAKDLSEYHLQFMAITTWLIDKNQLGDLEQQRAYIRAFQTPLLAAVNNRLQLKNPDHYPNIPYKVSEVYEAARFVLQGAPTIGYTGAIPSTPATNHSEKSDSTIKIENLAPLMADFAKTIVEALRNNNNGNTTSRSERPYQERPPGCIGCGGDHNIPDCDTVEEFIKAGKCRRNHENKVVLPNGLFVPRNTPGRYLCDRIEEWHRRNPHQLAATIASNVKATNALSIIEQPSVSTYTLSTDERIATVKAELFNLEKAKETQIAVVRTRAQQKTRTPADDTDDQAVRQARLAIPRIEEVPDEDAAPQVPTVSISNSQPIIPEHPYRNARDAAYSPPVNRNIAVQDKSNPIKRAEPAYKTLPPVHDPAIATQVYKRSMDAPITITQRELLSLSPEVRSQVRDVTTTRRIHRDGNNMAQNYLEEEAGYDIQQLLQTVVDIPPAIAIDQKQPDTPPQGSLVTTDPVEVYYKSLREGETPDPSRLIVAIESGAIRSITALIDNRQKRECILDPGCQIITMSEQVCHDIGLAYDPSIVLSMQSANGNIDPSLGLARNVPFRIGPITCYLQVHIIKSPAYDVLLGRPFDILTQSIVRNFANEDQTITISDPNTGQRVTVPTINRSQKYRQREDF